MPLSAAGIRRHKPLWRKGRWPSVPKAVRPFLAKPLLIPRVDPRLATPQIVRPDVHSQVKEAYQEARSPKEPGPG